MYNAPRTNWCTPAVTRSLSQQKQALLSEDSVSLAECVLIKAHVGNRHVLVLTPAEHVPVGLADIGDTMPLFIKVSIWQQHLPRGRCD